MKDGKEFQILNATIFFMKVSMHDKLLLYTLSACPDGTHLLYCQVVKLAEQKMKFHIKLLPLDL